MTGDQRSTHDYDLICLGGLSVDIILRAARLPTLDEKLVVQYGGEQAGGLVANTACAAARLGLKVAWAGVLGDDDFGRLAMDAFAQFGVDTRLATIVPGSTTDFTVILLDPSGKRTILVVPTSPSPPALGPDVMEALARTRMVYTIPQLPAWFASVASTVHEGAGLVAIDIETSSPVRGEELQTVLGVVDLVFCDRGGLLLATGDSFQDLSPSHEGEAIRRSAQHLVQMGVQTVCVTLGEGGALGISSEQTCYTPGYCVPVVDTTGAGDCFHGAFLYAYDTQRSLRQAIEFANAAAALSVGHPGARGGLPTEQVVMEFLAGAGAIHRIQAASDG